MNEQTELDLALSRVTMPDRNRYMEALEACYDWLDSQRDGVQFTAGQLAECVSARLYAAPAEPRVWGAVIRELHRRKRIRHTGRISNEGRSHRGIAAVWEVFYGREKGHE